MVDDGIPGGSDWTPQELAGLGATVFGLEPEQVDDCFIIVTGKDGTIYHSYAVESSKHRKGPREEMCRLVYISSILGMAQQLVLNQLHDEAHSE